MKKLKIAVFFLCAMAGILITACGKKAVNSKEINLKLDSLSLNGKNLIEQNLSKQEGVFFVKAHLRKQVVTIVYDSTRENVSKLAGLLEKMGYKTEVTLPPVPEHNK